VALIVICGSTAAGKTALGIRIAQYLNTPILGADSRQIYKDFDIGTAKPSLEERSQAEHRLIDLVDPRETFNVARYQALALQEIESLSQAQKPILFVGGSGLYLRSVSGGWTPPAVPPNPKLRAQLAEQPLEKLLAQLQERDPEAAQRIHSNDRVRIERALEVCLLSGKPFSTQGKKEVPEDILTLGISVERSELHRRIAERVHKMMQAGWIEEVQELREKYGSDLPLLKTLGYSELGDYLDGKLTREVAIEQTIIRTRQFAKRQMTWFRAEPGIQWIDPGESPMKLWERIDQFLEKASENV
jgi:tRNA dimethylallyltransferase